MKKPKKAVEVKLEVLKNAKEQVKRCWTQLNEWCSSILTDKAFAGLMTQDLRNLEEIIEMLEKRSIKFGTFDEKLAAKFLYETYQEMAPEYGFEIPKVPWDKLLKKDQRLKIAAVKKVMERLTTK